MADTLRASATAINTQRYIIILLACTMLCSKLLYQVSITWELYKVVLGRIRNTDNVNNFGMGLASLGCRAESPTLCTVRTRVFS